MKEIIIYHNSRCSKSRQTLELLTQKGYSPKIINYLDNVLSYEDIENLIIMLKIKPRELLRKSEAEYKENNLDNSKLTDKEIINYMVKIPKLIERPIVVFEDNAIIGRPPENIYKLL